MSHNQVTDSQSDDLTPNSQTTKPSKTSQILSHLHLSSHRESKEKEEVPPRLQEAIDQMKERKERKLEDMEKNGQKPKTRTSQAHAFEYGGAFG